MPNHDESPDDELEDEPEVDLEVADPETQKSVMRSWFLSKYTDPVENTPYESAEGGYIYIWGGPYDALEELSARYSGEVPDEVIEELADELNDITPEWTGNPDRHRFDDYIFDDPRLSVHRQSFIAAMFDVDQLLQTSIDRVVLQPFLRLLYGNVITILETYLFDLFYSAIQKDENVFRKFVEKNEDFIAKRIRLSEVLAQHEKIQQTVREALLGIAWHNLPRIEPLFDEILGIKFDTRMKGELIKAVLIRHDIVHRNGRTKEGVEVVLTVDQITELIALVKEFVESVQPPSVQVTPLPGDTEIPF